MSYAHKKQNSMITKQPNSCSDNAVETLKEKQEVLVNQLRFLLEEWGDKHGVKLTECAYNERSGCGYILEVKSERERSLWNDCQIKFEFCKSSADGAQNLIVGIIGKQKGDIESYRTDIDKKAFREENYHVCRTNENWLVWKDVPGVENATENGIYYIAETFIGYISEMISLINNAKSEQDK